VNHATAPHRVEAPHHVRHHARRNSPLGFIQLQETWKPDENTVEVASLLSKVGGRISSTELSTLSTKLTENPFVKVRGLIETMITRLQQEAANDATHQGWCVEETNKATKEREYRHAELETLETEHRELQSKHESLTDQIAMLSDELTRLRSELAEASTLRQKEEVDNRITIRDATEGMAATKEAIDILDEYYSNAATAEVPELLQGAPEAATSSRAYEQPEAPDAGFDGAYQGDSSSSGGIMAMLDVIMSDFKRSIVDTGDEEKQATRDFTAFEREMTHSIDNKQTSSDDANHELGVTADDINTNMSNLRESQRLLDQSMKSLTALDASCKAGGGDAKDLGGDAADREAKRMEEISALNDALCLLDDGINKEPECIGRDVFLQKRK